VRIPDNESGYLEVSNKFDECIQRRISLTWRVPSRMIALVVKEILRSKLDSGICFL
jgi:hypothetical protein